MDVYVHVHVWVCTCMYMYMYMYSRFVLSYNRSTCTGKPIGTMQKAEIVIGV